MSREDFISMCYNGPIKHELMRDVCFMAVLVEETDTHFKLDGHWINKSMKPAQVIAFESIEIAKADAHRWEPYYEV